MRAALAAILLLAAALHFTGIGWGLRHHPDQDERPFVESAAQMVAHRDLDHRFYEYPALFIYLLAPAVAFLHPAEPGPSAYLAARCLVAVVGVAAAGLAFLLGRLHGGPRTGLVAASFLAVSPLEIVNAHEVKPDVVLGAFALVALLAFAQVSERARGDWIAGVGVGAATAVKFSGALLGPVYAAYRLVTPGPSRRLLLAALVSVGTFFLLSPYTLLHPWGALEGMTVQLSYHYAEAESRVPPGFRELLGVYAGTLTSQGLGALGTGLAVLALFDWKDWRRRLPLAALPAIFLAVFSTAHLKHDRFVLPSLGALAVLAGLGVSSLGSRLPRLSLALALLAPVPPLVQSVQYVAEIRKPGTRDVALDWIEAHAATGARVLCSDPVLGLDPGDYEVLPQTGEPRYDALLARHVDFVVTSGEPLLSGLAPSLVAEPRSPWAGPRLSVYAVPSSLRARYQPIPLEAAWLKASSKSAHLAFVVDGRRGTDWHTLGPQRPGDFVEVDFPRPVTVGRIELELGRRPLRQGRDVDVWLLPESGDWLQARVVSGRPQDLTRVPETNPPSQELLLLAPAVARGLRLVQNAAGDRRWGFAELRVYAPAPDRDR